MINDFTAPRLVPASSVAQFADLGGRRSGHATGDNRVGTKLGVSGVIPMRAGWHALATEGDHVTLSPSNEREAELLLLLIWRFGHVSAERLLSGPGQVDVYCANHGLAGTDLEPADITERGLANTCDICRTVLHDFCAMLGTVTGNLVLTIGARGGAYVGGGIVPRLKSIFADSPFRERFETHGRLTDYLRDVPLHRDGRISSARRRTGGAAARLGRGDVSCGRSGAFSQ